MKALVINGHQGRIVDDYTVAPEPERPVATAENKPAPESAAANAGSAPAPGEAAEVSGEKPPLEAKTGRTYRAAVFSAATAFGRAAEALGGLGGSSVGVRSLASL